MSKSELLISVLEDISGILQKTQVNLKKSPKSRLTKGHIETRQRNLEEYWTTFRSTHQDLVKCTPTSQRADLAYFVNDTYAFVEDLYLCLQGDLADMLDTLTSTRTAASTCPQDITMGDTKPCNNIVKLPRIQLPTFTGTYEGWPAFNDMFTSLIHNNTSLNKVQKLHYLKSSVVGEAEALLRNLQVTEDNYDQAWDCLKHRYGNKRLIVNSLMKRLFFQKKISTPNASHIKNLLDTTSECLNSIKNQNISIESWDPVIIFFVVQKLDADTHRAWEEHTYNHNSNELPTWMDIKMFLEKKFRTLELTTATSSTTSNTIREKVIKEKSFHVTSRSLPVNKVCSMCDDKHTLSHCSEFSKLQPIERSEFVKKKGLCFNCLIAGHTAWKCRAPVSCHICSRRHHSLLHQTTTINKQSDSNETQTKNKHVSEEIKHPLEHMQINQSTISSYFTMKMSTTLLATAMVYVRNNKGQCTILRALIDQGSQANFISERATQLLDLRRIPSKGTIIGVGSTQTPISSAVEFELRSKHDDEFKIQLKAYVIKSKHITKLPSESINVPFSNWSHLQGLTLADPEYNQPGHIDMLLGVEVCAHIFKSEIIKGPPGSPCAQNTSLGWIIFGKIHDEISSQKINVMHHLVDDVHDMLRNLWEVDSQENSKLLTKEEELCENIYKNNYTRNEEGRYIVKLPFKVDKIKSTEGNTKEIALKRLQHLERRFERNHRLKIEYTKAINNYLELNHMEEIKENEKDNKAVYLPHHAVLREDKETSKLRVVFDASAKGTNNISLNDELLVGPQLQEDVRYLIMRWRLNRICFMADIQTMYREILVRAEDADYQRILWRYNSDEPLKEYRLLRVTFGTASAPYLAVRTLHQVADDEGCGDVKYDKAVQVIKHDFFMDDLLSGQDTVTEAIELAKNITYILQRGGFILRKWSSNSEKFLKAFEPEKRSTHVSIDIKLDGKIRALGLTWNMGTDKFEYELNLPDSPKVITKRSILGDVQRLFDPLGWLVPAFIPAKILIQKLWQKKLGWDEEVDPETKRRWLEIRQGLQDLKDIEIDRWVRTTIDTDDVTIHGFCDASVLSYGAVAYLRVQTAPGEYKVYLIAAKARVAPVKPLSLPRLELCGAVLLSKLLKQISDATRIPISKIYCWSDSTVVLSWLNGDPNRWQTFVRNRVVTILGNIGSKWSHVDSLQNPADIASRGSSISDLKKHNLWWQGPNWLKEENIKFNCNKILDTTLEMKNNIEVNLKLENENSQNLLMEQFKEFDTLIELLNTVTYCTRFLNFNKDNTNLDSIITVEELDRSLTKCIAIVQRDRFSEEIEDLNKIKRVKNRSKLKLLNPYLDSQKLLRVGGRIRNSNLNIDSKHPIILDDNNHLTAFIVADAHKRTLHGGVQLMMNYIRSKYWILKAKKLVKGYISKCLICARQRATVHTQLMGDLPKERVTPARPFLHSGVDFAGPYNVLMSKGRGAKTNKAYIAIFVCMATKAIHLELVSDMTSEAFIGAFRRFVARRGVCSHLWSDQGRNFIGANRELLEAWKDAKLEFQGGEIEGLLAKDGTQWHFVPAYSPYFGGLWEAGVKSMKYHLRRVLKTNLTYEEMTTVLCQIEACLNSRPLCPIDDKECESVLTPGHFLIGEAPLSIPSPEFKNVKITNLSRWQYTQKLLNDFWKSWQQEYLSRLQQRPKWLKRTDEFEIGQIVLIKTDFLPPGKWSLGRIVDKHPGPDGITRVYSVKSGSNIVKRSVSKLCLMPIDTTS